MNDAYLSDNSPVLITGVTGAQGSYLDDEGQYGGKSALATWWTATHGSTRNLVIFGNFKNDGVSDVLTDFREVGSISELATAMSDGWRRFVLTPNDGDWEAVSRRLEGFIRELPDAMTKLVVLDESPELDEDAVLSFVRVHGNGANCKTLVLAQSPTDLSTSIVKQTLLCWVGPMKNDYLSWFRTHDYEAAFEFIDSAHDPYHWSVVLGKGEDEWHHYQPVDERWVV
ncbi:hypothetical protein [Halosegnis longus]|uniref:Uncharacterized protein n=1 Tax=Halosegnis longus TaxID=2216012 RepID=A0AAJ4R732_9EURY|nr:hypothetical protein Nmn1133_01345 [Salella cibi]